MSDLKTVLRRPDVEARVGLSRSTLYALMKRGQFPKPIKLTSKAVAWRSADIDRWLSERELAQ